MWTIFKVFTEFFIILLLFYVLVFLGTRHVGILVPRSEMEHVPLALEGEVLTTAPPRNLTEVFIHHLIQILINLIHLDTFSSPFLLYSPHLYHK